MGMNQSYLLESPETKQIKSLIGVLVKGQSAFLESYREILKIVRDGAAPSVFSIGDQIITTWNDGTHDYDLPWDVVSFGSVINANGDTVPGLWLQSHYALEGVQFDGNEAFYVADNAAIPAGTYHFTMANGWGSNVIAGKSYEFTLTQSVPAGGMLVLGTASSNTSGLPDTAPANWMVRSFATGAAQTPLEIVSLAEGTGGTDLGSLSSTTKYSTSGLNNMQRAAYGYNRWSMSAMRQWLNSAAAVNGWWTQQNPFDHAPDQLFTVRGFMAGLPADFLEIVNPVRVTTALNTVSDDQIGSSENTLDRFFMPSLEQEYIAPQAAGVEGAYWPYWKERLGLTNPQAQGAAGANANHIRYDIKNHSNPVAVRLRSASRGHACYVWYVSTAGYAYTYYATYASRPCPACVIC